MNVRTKTDDVCCICSKKTITRISRIVVLLVLPSFVSVAVGQTGQTDVRFQRNQQTVMLEVNDVAAALAMKVNVMNEGTILGFCPKNTGGLCVPLNVKNISKSVAKEALFVDADFLSTALHFEYRLIDDRISIRPTAIDLTQPAATYHREWPVGRGFEVGETVPDIPLTNLRGEEVRFSKFLGKKYILFCWASW